MLLVEELVAGMALSIATSFNELSESSTVMVICFRFLKGNSFFKGVLNVGGGAPLSTKRIAEMIRKGSGSRSGISSIRIEETKCQLVFDNKKAYKMLGWKPQAKFEDVIVELLNLHNHEN